ncbi:MAG: DUF4215 domain-containing protein [Kofleriaceae bacterium]
MKSLWVLGLVAGCGFGDNSGSAAMGVDGSVDPAEDARVEVDAPTSQPACGNGAREGTEECDDGNLASGDGCSPICMVETAAACSLVPQGGCSGATPACDIGGIDVTECRAVTSMGTSNNHCSSATECKAGYTCIGHDDPNIAPWWCARFCLTDANCTGSGSRCIVDLVDENADPLNVTVCSNSCNPVTQSGCPSGMGCLVSGATGGAYTNCRYMGGTPDGSTCVTSSDCFEGSTCVTIGSTNTCRSYCTVGDDSTCVGSEQCDGFATPLMIGTTEYGVCR